MYDLERVLTVMLAGGNGTRFLPLTRVRAKPAIPLAGNFRLIDVPLSNIVNADFRTHCYILVQANPWSLSDHINSFADAGIASMTNEFIQVVMPSSQKGFYRSDAHSLSTFQHIWNIRRGGEKYDFIIIMMSDQIIRIDPGQVIEELIKSGADMSMVYAEVSVEEAKEKLGVLEFSRFNKVSVLQEKPIHPHEIKPGICAGNIALYVMRSRTFEYLMKKISDYPQTVSLSRGALQDVINNKNVIGYNLTNNRIKGKSGNSFFLDIESADTLAEFSFNLCQPLPDFNFHDHSWPIFTTPRAAMPSKIGQIKGENFLLGYNVIIQNGVSLFRVVVNRNTIIGEGSVIESSLIFDNVKVGRRCRLHKVIIDKEVEIPDGLHLSSAEAEKLSAVMTLAEYRSKYEKKIISAPPVAVLTPDGYLVIPKGYKF